MKTALGQSMYMDKHVGLFSSLPVSLLNLG